MIHVAFWVFVFCASTGLAVLVVGSVDRGYEFDPKDPKLVLAKQCLGAIMGFLAGMSLGYIVYDTLTIGPKGW